MPVPVVPVPVVPVPVVPVPVEPVPAPVPVVPVPVPVPVPVVPVPAVPVPVPVVPVPAPGVCATVFGLTGSDPPPRQPDIEIISAAIVVSLKICCGLRFSYYSFFIVINQI